MKHQIEKIERKKEKREGCIDVSMTTGERGLSWLLSRTATGSSSQPIPPSLKNEEKCPF